MTAQYVAPGPLGLYSDAARRASDIVNLHLLADRDGAPGRWVALALLDGSSDNTTYSRRADAVRHQLHPELHAYLCIAPDGLTPRGAELFLKFNRELYDNGMRMTDPDNDREVVMQDRSELYPLTDSRAEQAIRADWAQQLGRALARGAIDPRLSEAMRKAIGL